MVQGCIYSVVLRNPYPALSDIVRHTDLLIQFFKSHE